jgi:2-polyprenyl-3-methyl-5-hydroxy-6-metoxy-1,4-benzoquinol methylase
VSEFNPSYVGRRSDVERLLPPGVHSVLDVGCSVGALGASIKAGTGAQVTGIEYSPAMAAEAEKVLDRVFVGDATAVIDGTALEGMQFDAIIFADVLEHLPDPWLVLRRAVRLLSPGGRIIASLPNIRHLSTIYHLVVLGYWPYRDRGIHDRTHLRFFTRRNVLELFRSANLEIESVDAKYRLVERPHRINRFAKYFALPGLRGFLAFQYLVTARPASKSS